MLTQIHLTNFKCFAEKREFELAKVNLFTGLNGRGKSSVLQSVLLLSQSAYTLNSFRSLLVSSNRWIKLGDFSDILNSTNEQPIVLGFRSDKKTVESTEATFSFYYKQHDGFSDRGKLVDYESNGNLASKIELGGLPLNDKNTIGEVNSKRSFDYTDDPLLLSLFKNVHYVSADRMGARLYYDKFGALDTKTGCHGEYFLNILVRNPQISASFSRSGKSTGLLEICQEWLDYIFEGAAISVKDAASTLELEMSSTNDGVLHKSVNVGFGYSYILALLVTTLIANREEIAIFENPEAHLHPKAQSRFMELIAKRASEEHAPQFFIESHSEHILNALRVAVANPEVQITKDDVTIHYFDKDFSSQKMDLKEDGFITNWPKGFFDEAELTMSLLFRYKHQRK